MILNYSYIHDRSIIILEKLSNLRLVSLKRDAPNKYPGVGLMALLDMMGKRKEVTKYD